MSPEQPEAVRVLVQVVDALEELNIAYHVAGSYASSVHGIPRQSQDVDLVVDLPASAVPPLVSKLSGDSYIKEDSVREAIRTKRSFKAVSYTHLRAHET